MKRFLPQPRELALAPQLATLDLLDVTLEATVTVLATEHPGIDPEADPSLALSSPPGERQARRVTVLVTELHHAIAAYRALVLEQYRAIADNPDLPF